MPNWGMISITYADEAHTMPTHLETYWEAEDGVSSSLGVDDDGNFNESSFYTFIFNDNYSGSGVYTSFSSPLEIVDFVMYPAYLDLDNDGIADGEEIKMEIVPDVFSGSFKYCN